jgi:hypothetical protein
MVHPEKGVARTLQKTNHISEANKKHTKLFRGNMNLWVFITPRKPTDCNIIRGEEKDCLVSENLNNAGICDQKKRYVSLSHYKIRD